MAGIGFELQKIIRQGGIGSFFKATLAGMIIVAGPWLLTIVTIFLISQLAQNVLREGPGLFMSVIIYTYATSLFLFGGAHYIFTRYLSDLVYFKKKREIGAILVLFSLLIMILASAVALPALAMLKIDQISYPNLFKLAAWLLYLTINVLWILMIFISLLKKYMSIFMSYLIGMALSLAGILFISSRYGIGGALCGFTAGQMVTVIILSVLSFKAYRPGKFMATLKGLGTYFRKFKYLFLSGFFYQAGIWIDKFVCWYFKGNFVEGSFFKLFDTYDIPVYLANLAMIPGLIYFIVITEINFFIHLKRFLYSVSRGIYMTILAEKNRLTANIKSGLREQSAFQLVLTVILIVLAPLISQILFGGNINIMIFRLTLSAVFFHFLFLTMTIFLFYFQRYRQSFIACLVYFLVNLTVSLAAVYYQWLPGFSYLCAGIVGCLTAALMLYADTKTIIRSTYSQYN